MTKSHTQKKRRHAKGISVRYQLTDIEKKNIIDLRGEGMTYQKIAIIYNRSISCIAKVLKNN